MIVLMAQETPVRASNTAAAAAAQARICARATGEPAVTACRRALELGLPSARQPAIEAALASRLASLERWDDVVEVYRGAASRRPGDAQARVRLGAALLHMQDRAAEAETELREAVRLRPEDAEAQALLGNALALRERFAEAVAAFDQALRLDPTVLDQRPAARAAYEAARRGERWPPRPSPPS
jgi:tetratricopeptide (TPR) repeat protein